MFADTIVATVTRSDIGEDQVKQVVAVLNKALPTHVVGCLIEIGNPDGSSGIHLNAKFVATTFTVAIRARHGELGLWVAAACAATLGQVIVDAQGDAFPATSMTVRKLLGSAFSEGGRELATKLGLILPQFRGGAKSIKF